MSKGVLDYVESITQAERKRRWTSTPQKPAPKKPEVPAIPEDDADLMAFREELLGGGGTQEE